MGGYIPVGNVGVRSVLFDVEMGWAQNYSSNHVVLFNSEHVASPALARFKFSDARINNGGIRVRLTRK